jgi:two-component system, OmpR family, phosphate regulon sensor histidine kinase PhoR
VRELDAGGLLASFLDNQRPRAEAAGLSVCGDGWREAELPVKADRDGLEQVFLNLLDNAIKYAAEGRDLTVSAVRENGRVCIRFMDRGPGVAASHRERIFDEFHRVDDSLTAENPGCGLGLNIARQLARAMGGDLVYEPRPGGGSVFLLTLPLVAS